MVVSVGKEGGQRLLGPGAILLGATVWLAGCGSFNSLHIARSRISQAVVLLVRQDF